MANHRRLWLGILLGATVLVLLTSAGLALGLTGAGQPPRARIGSPTATATHAGESGSIVERATPATPTSTTPAPSRTPTSTTPAAATQPASTHGHVPPLPSPQPTATATATATVTATPQPEPTATASPTATAMPTSTGVDDYTVLGPTTLTAATGGIQSDNYVLLNITVQNTGTTIWGSGYWFYCVSNCVQWHPAPLPPAVAPDAQVQAPIWILPQAPAGHNLVVDTQWRMSNGFVLFGPVTVVAFHDNDVVQVLSQSAPGCNDPAGITWVWQRPSTGNSISCTSAGLLVQQTGSTTLIGTVQGAPGLDYSNYILQVHVHFTGASTAYAGLAFSTTLSCGPLEGGVRPNFDEYYWILQSSGTPCFSAPVFTVDGIVSSDFDLWVGVQGSLFGWAINGTDQEDGGMSAPVPYVGIMVTGGAGSVVFSNFSIVTPVPETFQYQVLSS